jgi:hypothetical protein
MSKVVSTLVKLAVVSSTLAVLGTMIVLPVAYANDNDVLGFCQAFHGPNASYYYESDSGHYFCAFREPGVKGVQKDLVPDSVAKH